MPADSDRGAASCDQVAASEQVAARLSTTALVRSPAHHYRNRMVYDLRADGASGCELLSLPTVWEARCVVYRWAVEASSMPPGFCARLRVKSQLGARTHTRTRTDAGPCCADREVTVRESRAGTLQLKLLVQSRSGAALDADPLWPHERARLVCHLRRRLPLLRSLSMQVSVGRARPPKDAPCVVLWGELCLLQSEPAYLVGPETFSQVNHHTGTALLAAVTSWLRRPEVRLVRVRVRVRVRVGVSRTGAGRAAADLRPSRGGPR